MQKQVFQTFPSDVSIEMLANLIEDAREREDIMLAIIQRFNNKYNNSLEVLESRLASGKGTEHPDWEDSIEWRNAVEAQQRAQVTRNLLEWLLHSIAPSRAS